MNEEQKINYQSSLENTIGTPSAQKVIILLVTWGNLSIKELMTKSKLSKSQIHSTLKSLQNIELVTLKIRGIYTLTETKFAHLLQEAYTEKIIETINKQIYQIKLTMKKKDLETANRMFEDLYEKYNPILNKNFSYVLSSLANRFIEAYK